MPSSVTTYSVKTLFLSDLHLGTRSCHAEALLQLLDNLHCQQVILLGDIIDLWAIQRTRRGLSGAQLAVVEKLLQMATAGTEILYITGNHDEGFRRILRAYPFQHGLTNIKLCNQATFTAVDGRRYLLLHGDQFDKDVRCAKWLSWLGDTIYSALLSTNRWWNRLRLRQGHGYWSLASAVKSRSKKALNYIADYEKTAVKHAQRRGFDGIFCGHIHVPADKWIAGIHYLNTGDWQDSCTAIIEHLNGDIELLNSQQWLRSRANEHVLLARVS